MTQEEVNKSRSNYFGAILYPSEDRGHAELIKYCTVCPSFSIAYIEHLPDTETGKNHIHAIIKTPDRITLNSFLKYFDPWIKYAESIHSLNAYLLYMLHNTPNSMIEGKKPYSIEALQGDSKIWRGLVQNAHFMYFNDIMSFYSVGDTLLDVMSAIQISCTKEKCEELFDYIHKCSFLIISVINQENNKYLRKEV